MVRSTERVSPALPVTKAAGEVLCADLPRLLKGLHVQVRRLPRLQTD